MIETLVIAACLYGTNDSCLTAGSAYYKQVGIEQVISDKEKQLARQYPISSLLVSGATVVYKREIMVNLSAGKSCSINLEKSTINYRGEF